MKATPSLMRRGIFRLRCSGWHGLAALRQLSERRRTAASLKALGHEEDRTALAALRADGIYVTSLDRLALANTTDMLEQAAIWRVKLERGEMAKTQDALAAPFAMLADPAEVARRSPQIWLWGLQHRLLDLVQAYLGLTPHCLGAFVRRDLTGGRPSGTRRWHIDINDFRYLKIIVYLNDVSAAGGPFQYLPDLVSRPLLKAGRPKSIDHSRIARTDCEPWTSCEGPAGSVILVDTARLYHRGMVPQQARDTLFYSYASHYPARPDLCADVRKRSGMQQLTASLTKRQAASLGAGV